MALLVRTAGLLFAALALVPAFAQEAPLDPELERAQLRQKVAEAEKAAAEAQLAAFQAKYVIDTANLPKGAMTATDLNIEPTMLAYAAAASAADSIAAQIAGKTKKVIIADAATTDALMAYRAYDTQLTALEASIGQALNERPSQPEPPCNEDSAQLGVRGVPLAGIVAAATGVISLFKVDTTLTGMSVDLQTAAVETLIAKELAMRCVQVVLPRAYQPSVADSPLLKRVTDLRTKRQELARQVAALGGVAVRSARQARSADAEQKRCSVYIARLREYKTRLGELLARLNTVLAPYETPGTDVTKTVQALLTASMLDSEYRGASILAVSAVAGGGTTRTRTNVIGSRLSFSGGAVISYTLVDSAGQLLAADVVAPYSGYIRDRNLNEVLGSGSGERSSDCTPTITPARASDRGKPRLLRR